MARVLLLMPPLAQPLGSPYVGQLYLAASLRAGGHEVRGLDLGAARAPAEAAEAAEAVAVAAAFDPQIVGVTVFTTGALEAYRLARRLAAPGRLLVAGGPHATVRPDEALDRGFDVAVVGEGEVALAALARAVDSHGVAALERIGAPEGVRRAGRRLIAAPIARLDDLPPPVEASGVFDPDRHVEGGALPPGTVTSRGCPARCTFCANHVTGRAFRWRSRDNVLAELRALVAGHGARHVAFWDDAFTARRSRVEALCEGMRADGVLGGLTWSCITPASMVRPGTLERMFEAGCRSVNFGIESGDPDVLRAIGKGTRPARLLRTVRAARRAGMQTVVNFMFGFPEEDAAALERTAALMEELAPETDFFNPHGVLIPMPGTPVYERHHRRFGFTRWWLDPDRRPRGPSSPGEVTAAAQAARDPALELDFFRYAPEVRARIAELVVWKADHNAATVARMTASIGAMGGAGIRSPGPARP